MSKAFYTRQNLIDHLQRLAYSGVSEIVSIADLEDRSDLQGGRTNWGDVPLQVRAEVIPNAALFKTAGVGIAWPGSGPQGDPSRVDVPYPVSTVEEARKAVDDYVRMKPEFVKIWVDNRGGTKKTLTPPLYRTNIKKWTVGSPIQAPLDALESLRKKHPFEADQVKQVTVRIATDEAAVVDNRDIPDICLQYMLAVMLLDKTASFKAAHDNARMHDPAVLRERAKIQLVPDAELEKLLPKRVAIVELTLADGTHLTERVDAVRGTAQNPMGRDEVVAKARDLMSPILGATASANLIDRVFALETVKDIRELRPLLQRA